MHLQGCSGNWLGAACAGPSLCEKPPCCVLRESTPSSSVAYSVVHARYNFGLMPFLQGAKSRGVCSWAVWWRSRDLALYATLLEHGAGGRC